VRPARTGCRGRARPSKDTGSSRPSPATWPAPAAPPTSCRGCCCTPSTRAAVTPGTSRCAPDGHAPWTTSAGCGPAPRQRSAAPRRWSRATTHTRFSKADDRTSLPRTAKDKLLQPAQGEGIGPDHDEPFPFAETVIHSWVPYMEACGEIPTEPSEYAALTKELDA
jgi:hypothetical protein